MWPACAMLNPRTDFQHKLWDHVGTLANRINKILDFNTNWYHANGERANF